MGLFKSREERKMEREIEIKKGINSIKRNIKNLEKNEGEYIKKAKRARQIGSPEQLAFLKQTLKRTASQRRLMERQLLSIETAMQIKQQAEAHAQFAKAMNALSTAIGLAFGSTDLAATQREFEKAMAKAQTMEERMEVFLEMTSEQMVSEGTGEELVPEEEIERMIDMEIAQEEGEGLDEEIRQELKDIEKELGRDS